MKLLKSIFVGMARFIYLLPALGIIIFLVLLFGHPILGPKLIGSDNANFVTLASWLSGWFPRIPFWFPQEGAGMSFTISYPTLNHLIVVILEKISSYPIAVIFRIWSLITVVLTSVGLYFLSFRLTKNQTVSALAAIFYPLMPITWVFLLGWGFSAEQLSYMFVSPVLIFLSLFLDGLYLTGFTRRTKIYFLLFTVFVAILLLAHPSVFVGILMIAALLFIVYPLFNYKSEKVDFKKVTLVGLVSIVITFLLSSFWILPFFRYQSIVAKGAPVEKEKYNRNLFLQNGIYALNAFSITDKTASYESYDDPPQNLSGWVWRDVSFPFIISVLALVGLTGSLFINRKVFAFGFANLLPLAVAVFPNWTYSLIKFPFSEYILNWRAAILPSRFIIPLLAAFGCYTLSYLITFPLDILSKKIKLAALKYSLKAIFIFITAILTVSVASILLWKFRSWPINYPNFLLSYGKEVSAPSAMLDLRNVWRKELDFCFGTGILPSKEEQPTCYNLLLQQNFWEHKLNIACGKLRESGDNVHHEITQLCGSDPGPEVVKKVVDECSKKTLDSQYINVCQAKTDSFWDQVKLDSLIAMVKSKDLFGEGREIFHFPLEREILELMPDNPNTRVDIGTYLGIFMMIEPFYSEVPELPVYYNQATLIKKLWNYQIGVFNQKDGVWPQDSILYELSKYFGLEYILLSENLVPLDKYERTGWQRIKKQEKEAYGGLALWQFDEPAGLLRATTKPLVLVIGQDKVDGYFRIFHLANLGVLPFDEGLIVKGESYVDAYTAEELKYFDAVVLEGYAYKSNNRQKGWQELDEYVKNGGSLLINTGWQYSSADWELSETPDFFPLKTLEWTSAGATGDYKHENGGIAGEVDVKKFGPLIYDNKEWSISSSDRSDLRDWARVVISANNMPLVAGGKYGLGRVVWMGLDIPGHLGFYKDNEEEVALYKSLLAYLLKNKDGKDLSATFKRDYPDKLEISLDESSGQKTAVYWSEAYYPDFKAKFVENGRKTNLKVYKAGPGMTLFVLPSVSAGSKIIYEYKTPIFIIIARTISLATFVAIIITILRPKLVYRAIGLFSEKKGSFRRKFVEGILGSKHDEDINY